MHCKLMLVRSLSYLYGGPPSSVLPHRVYAHFLALLCSETATSLLEWVLCSGHTLQLRQSPLCKTQSYLTAYSLEIVYTTHLISHADLWSGLGGSLLLLTSLTKCTW